MLTRAGRGASFPQREESAVFPERHAHARFSLRPEAAPAGAITLAAMVATVATVLLVERLSGIEPVLARVLSILMLVFAPAMLAAIYSLFFEKSRAYAVLDFLIAGIVLGKEPATWYWLKMYVPFVIALTVFCLIVRLLSKKFRE